VTEDLEGDGTPGKIVGNTSPLLRFDVATGAIFVKSDKDRAQAAVLASTALGLEELDPCAW